MQNSAIFCNLFVALKQKLMSPQHSWIFPTQKKVSFGNGVEGGACN